MARGIYLDNATTTRPSDASVSKMIPFLTDRWGAPSAPHLAGQEVLAEMEESLKAVYRLLGAKENDSFVFTSSGAEAVNHVIASVYHDVTRSKGKNHFITANTDEAPAIMAMGRLEQLGCVAKMVNGDKCGQVTATQIADAVSPRTALVSLCWANGLTGVVNPVADIASLCRGRGILFHLDATHVLGGILFDPEEIGADFITFNGDQIHAPKGTGGLYIKEGRSLSPFILGGSEQGGLRAGTLNTAGLAALGCAAAELVDSRDLVCTEVARLRDLLEKKVVQGCPEAKVLFKGVERIPNTSTIVFPGTANEAFLFALNRKGVFASIGGGSFQQIGIILMACGIEEALAHSAVSFSLSRYTTDEEIERASEIIVEVAQKLRKMSLGLVKG